MNQSPSPPPAPGQRPGGNPPGPPPPGVSVDSGYNLVADKIGGVPNVRKKDNLYQALAIVVFVIIGLVVGWAIGGWPQGPLLGALGGLIAGTLISGAVLMVLGLLRKS